MKQKIPEIVESSDSLQQRMQKEKESYRLQRLQALYLVKTGQARTRKQVAFLLGVHRDTVGRWFLAYSRGGLSSLLTRKKAPGKPPTLSPLLQTQLKQRLEQEEGFASYGAIVDWIRTEYGIEVGYDAVYKRVRYQFKAKLKVPRKHHQKKTTNRLHSSSLNLAKSLARR